MSFSLHPAAERDIVEALDFYTEHASPMVAERFFNEFLRAAQLVVAYPGLGTPSANGRKVFPLRVFPFSLVYRERDDEIDIVVVRHQHRKPGHGLRRK